MEQSSYSTVDFLKRAIAYFGYKPFILQTDNGAEFTHLKKSDRTHPLDLLCSKLNIVHKRIRPRTPRHNGKVERSHRNDQERFYNHMSFYDYDDLQIQMKRYLNRSNNIPNKGSTPVIATARYFRSVKRCIIFTAFYICCLYLVVV